jgi:hypothetical protein
METRQGTDDVQLLTPIVNRHITPFAWIIFIGKELAHEVLEGETPLLKDPGFSILREDNIFRD